MNPFLRDYSDLDIQKLVDDNPLSRIKQSDLQPGKHSHLDDENDKDKEQITNETSKRFNEFMHSELKELEDQGEMGAEGQTAVKRHKKMKEEESKHKENLKKMKQNIKTRKGGFNRKNLNSNFFVNNKKTANEVKGWAFDFGVEESSGVTNQPDNFVALPGEGQKLRQEKQKLKAEKEKRNDENPQENQDKSDGLTENDKDQNEAEEDQTSKEKKTEEKKSKEEWANIIMTKNTELKDEYLKEGDFVYELYAILVHLGGAHAGHYFAYIKDSANNQWYKFNDVMVYRVSFLEIINTFGQKQTNKRRFNASAHNQANAYMLMYRLIDPSFNVDQVPISMISQDLKDEIMNDVRIEKEKLQERERKDNQMQLKVIYNDESRAFWVNRKEDRLNYLLQLAIDEFELQSIGIEHCRLRAYNIVNKVMQETYTGSENETFEDLKIFPLKTLALETKRPDEVFEEYDPNQIVLKIN